jgi:hypothetical protein
MLFSWGGVLLERYVIVFLAVLMSFHPCFEDEPVYLQCIFKLNVIYRSCGCLQASLNLAGTDVCFDLE